MPTRVVLAFLLICLTTSSLAQSFTQSAVSSGVNTSWNGSSYGGSVSMVDFNQDGFDDISLPQSGNPLFYVNNGSGMFQSVDLGIVDTFQSMQLCWVDFDNDDDLDLAVTNYLGPFHLYENLGDLTFENISISAGFPITSHLTYGNSWGDFDNDGFLDVYICNYNSDGVTNYLYRNMGDGTFEDVTVESGVGNGSRYSFQGLWFDYNKDGWQDLFVINDREVSSNYLYENNQDGTFSDVTWESGLQAFFFSMSNTGGDYDNDGDIDLFITNNPAGHKLYKNDDDGNFVNVAATAGMATYDMGWAALLLDYNNDGWQDLYIACSPFWSQPGIDKFFVNNEGSFTAGVGLGLTETGSWTHGCAVGDVNNDGCFDIFAVDDAPGVNRLYKSNPGPNHYLKVKLKGIMSNRDGIGSTIKLWAGNFPQMRHTYCGEGYMTQNSKSEIFGLGTNTIVDSLQVQWPSGHIDMYYNLDVDQSLILVEGIELSATITGNDEDLSICPGEFVTLSGGVFSEILWSNGDIFSEINVFDPGEYSFVATNNMGATVYSDTVVVLVHDVPIVDESFGNVTCYGANDGSIQLENLTTGISSVEWTDNISGAYLDNLSPGEYLYTLLDDNFCASAGSVTITQPDSLWAELEGFAVQCFGAWDGFVVVQAFGGTGDIDVFIDGYELDSLPQGDYFVQVVDENGCSLLLGVEISEPEELIVAVETTEATSNNDGTAEITINGGVGPYTIEWSTGAQDVSSITLADGSYEVTVTDSHSCSTSYEFDVLFNLIAEQPKHTELTAYPLPLAGTEFNLQGLGTQTVANIEIVSITGQKTSVEWEQSGNFVRLTLSQDLSAGNYIVRMWTTEGHSHELHFQKVD